MVVNPADESISNATLVELFTGDISYHQEMGFYLDENTSGKIIVRKLRDRDIRVTTAREQGQAGEGEDFLLLAKARDLGLVLVTRDLGFKKLHDRLMGLHKKHGASHAGIVLVGRKLDDLTVANVLTRFAEKYGEWADYLQDVVLNF